MNDLSTVNRKPLTILVPGGAGYIGSFTVKKLLDNGYKVIVLDSLENGHKETIDNRAILEAFDLKDQERTEKILKDYQIDAVIDFAAYLAVGESMEDPKKYFLNNVFNFIKLLEAMKDVGVKFLIKSSTAATYGNPEKDSDFPLKESYHDNFKPSESALLPGKWDGNDVQGEDFFQKCVEYYNENIEGKPKLRLTDEEIESLRIPTSIYGLTKLLDEILMKKYDDLYGIKSIALRYFNVCGAARNGEMGDDKPNPTNLMTVSIDNILGKSDKLKVFGDDYPTKDGTGIRDYIHPIDLANGHLKALEYLLENKVSNTFNLGCGNGYSVFDVIKAVEDASGTKVNYEVVPRRSGDPAISYSDPSKANRVLGWEAQCNLKDMAESAWQWHSTHPNGYKDS